MERLPSETPKEAFDAMLEAPLVEVGRPTARVAASPMQAEDEMASFAELYAQVNAGRAT